MIKKTNLGEKKIKLVYGVGINDADYVVNVWETVGYSEDGRQMQKLVWRCPFFRTWKSMLERCYSQKRHIVRPTYIGCSVVEEWRTFSNFKAWMEHQDWQGNQLDKDILTPGNKVYGPKYCAFVSGKVNSFVTERDAARGEWPIGVYWHKECQKFQAMCNNPFTRKQEYLGIFTCPNEAHKAWLKRKQELATLLAAIQTDPRIAKALVDRYVSPETQKC